MDMNHAINPNICADTQGKLPLRRNDFFCDATLIKKKMLGAQIMHRNANM
jgi:hypothetical protein